ncbi:glycosyltransferase [Demequina zhanjiangensis]|uniref:D-inositol 3-phosphate glycosyltransferase n=1 Tax=Demequina zhanjiangensis TaxID=3051659 RepID=A0ABT8G0A7_9MICO|nr:glycosyltransferase [Demequina sp. SYSU T00b26]MDN4472447.1 glycosyltransferase [Demequina sp. SYSU T00b26]
MRIAHIANFYGPTSGGLRTAMHALGKGYVEHGHKVLLVVPGAEDTDELTEFGRRITLRSPVLPLSGGYRMISRLRELRGVLRGFRPDVLEVSDRTTLRSLGGWAASQGVPSVFFSHERADGILAANLPDALGERLPLEAMADWHNRGTARRFTTIVSTTDFAAQEFDRIGVPVERVPLGVDLETFQPARRDDAVRAELAAPDESLILMASRLSSEKRPELAIDAVRILADRGTRLRLVCAGSGALAEQMRARAEGAPIDFLGFVSGRERFATLLASADLVVAPGPIETFGLAALEALASGTPVVVNAASALPEVVADAGIAARGTAEDFADAIEATLARPVSERRDAARARAEQMPWSVTVERMLEIHRGARERIAG